jgi:hypothetical protein
MFEKISSGCPPRDAMAELRQPQFRFPLGRSNRKITRLTAARKLSQEKSLDIELLLWQHIVQPLRFLSDQRFHIHCAGRPSGTMTNPEGQRPCQISPPPRSPQLTSPSQNAIRFEPLSIFAFSWNA